MIWFLLFFFELSSIYYLQAQDNFQLKTFTTDNGLPNNFIQSIAQDQTGFLWIATWDGLSRYDGYEFKNYYHKPGDSTSFAFFVIDKIVVDHLNNVWILCQGRPAVIYDRAKDCFNYFCFNSNYNSRLNDIAIGPDKNVWLVMGRFLHRYNIETKQLTSFEIKSDSNDLLINDNCSPQIVFDNTGGIWIYLWINYEYYIFKGTFLKDSTLLIHQLGFIPLNQYRSSGLHNNTGNFDIYIAESGKTWLFFRYGLFYLDSAKERFVENNSSIDPGEFKGKPYFIWTEDKTGIHIIKTKNNSLINLKPQNGDFTETVFIDKSDIIWSGDVNPLRENIGLNRYLKIPEYFKHYLTGRNENNSINLVSPIIKDKNKVLWVGVRNLDYLFRIKPDGTQEKVNFASRFDSQNRLKALSMVQNSDGVWIGTINRQLIYYDFLTKKMSNMLPDKNNDKTTLPTLYNLLQSNNSIIINSGKGIYRFIPETKSLNLYYQHYPESTGFSLVNDGKNGYWLGTQGNRVIHFDAELNKTAEFKLGPENNIVEHICVGDSNDIWVALMGGGLGHLYPESGKTELFTTADGLSNNVTFSILKDRKGNLWISTNQGLSRFNPRTRQFRNFGKAEGLLISEFNSESNFQAPDGEMFFGGYGGMVGFYPDSLDNYLQNSALTPLIITDFKVSGINRYFKKAVYEMDTLTLEKGDNNFQIAFTCLNFQNPEKIKYQYRLIGENDKWTETDYRNRKINYAHLAHRDYKLEIEATNESGEWVNKKSILVRIPHRLTEILWVRLSLLVLILLGIFFIIINYIKHLKLRARQVQDQLRLESLRGQMNPHFVFNSLNSINYFISKEDKLSANHYIADFSRLMRSILSNLSSDYVPFENELESLNDYLKLEYLRFGDKFNYSINADKISNSHQISVFPGMVQPFVENAIWHGVRGLEHRIGFINIEFIQVSQAKIQCIIEDDGIGRKMAQLYRNEMPGHKSRGIGIVLERLKIINNISKNSYRVTIEDIYPERDETGTRVTIDLPIRTNTRLIED
jgi:ligand-binding sensor domain-containing protein